MKNFFAILPVVVVVFLTAAASVPAQECYTPLEWIPKNYVSNLDRDKNFVDDAIDAMEADETINVILCLNGCASSQDNERLQQFIEESGGELGYRSPYISIQIANNITAETARKLGSDERVAMVELERVFEPTLDVSMAAARIRTSTVYAGANIEDVHPTIDGTGVTIAIMDTGVDNAPSTSGTVHTSFPAWKYVNGYDAFLNVETDPDDQWGHGTHVAGIALGTGGTSGTYRGAAPGARLVDIQIFKPGHITSDAVVIQALDKVIQRRVAWGIDVLNMSFGKNFTNTDGTDAISQHVNRVVRAGVIAVAAAGNNGPGNYIGPPAASDFAITVASADDQGTPNRIGDVLSSFSSRGPRMSDSDGMTEDEQKPDVTAYGSNIHAAQHNTANGHVDMSGTSMATPQVAGLAALILHANPGMDPLSVKELIERTAEDRGPSGWDVDYGHGIINGFAAVDEVLSYPQTDVYFSVYCNRPGSPAWWLSPDVTPSNPSVVEGSTNAIIVTVYNAGPNTAYNVKVRAGIYNFSNSTADYDICLHNIAVLPPGSHTFSCPWIPEADGLTPPTVHACLKAYIIYPNDTDPSNNCAQHNVNIVQTHSPALFTMTVVNPTGEDAEMEIVTEPSEREIEAQGWRLTMNDEDRNFFMGATDCPRTVTIALEAGDGNPPEQMPVTVTVRRRLGGQEFEVLGGVQMIGLNGNGTPRPPDRAIFDGIRHVALGGADLRSTPAALIVSEADDPNSDEPGGVEAQLGKADFWRGKLGQFDVNSLTDGQYISFVPRGEVNGDPDAVISEMKTTDAGDHVRLSVDFRVSRNTLTVEAYRGGELVAADINTDGIFANVWPPLDNMQITPFRRTGGVTYGEVILETETLIEVLGTSTATLVTGDRIVVRSGAQPPVPSYVATVEITANGPNSFTLTDEEGGLFNRPFGALGNPVLEWDNDAGLLTASRVTARSTVGVRADVPDLQSYALSWTGKAMDELPLSASLNLTAKGNPDDGSAAASLGAVSVIKGTDAVNIIADMIPVNAQSYRVDVYSGGALQYSATGLDENIGSADVWPTGGGQAVDEETAGPCFKLYWQDGALFTLSDGTEIDGDELRILPEDSDVSILSVAEVNVYGIGMDELQINGVEASSGLPVSVGKPGEQALPVRLYQNYPNPFSETTVFKFDLYTAAFIELEVYNLLGEKVADVYAGDRTQGTHEIEWKRRDASLALSSGTYIYRLKVRPLNAGHTFEINRQMVILE